MNDRPVRSVVVGKMKRLSSAEAVLASLLSWILAAVLFDPTQDGAAFAYIDPGSGSLLLQLIIASFVGLMFYLRSVRQFFVRFFRGLWPHKKPDNE